MGWFNRHQYKKSSSKKEQLWVICGSCKAHIFKQDWEQNLKVCPKCNYHERLSPRERLDFLVDPTSFKELFREIGPEDPLKFVDGKGSYIEKAREATEKTRNSEAVVTGTAAIEAIPVALGVMDFNFMGGSLGGGTGEKILKMAEHAHAHRLPYIVFSASGGARMHEGIISLMQMAKTCAGIARLHKDRIPYISVLTDPTYGGVSASYAMVGDLNIAEPKAMIGFAGKRVIEETIKQKLPKDFQTSEYLLQHGFVDRIVSRKEMRSFLASVLRYWSSN